MDLNQLTPDAVLAASAVAAGAITGFVQLLKSLPYVGYAIIKHSLEPAVAAGTSLGLVALAYIQLHGAVFDPANVMLAFASFIALFKAAGFVYEGVKDGVAATKQAIGIAEAAPALEHLLQPEAIGQWDDPQPEPTPDPLIVESALTRLEESIAAAAAEAALEPIPDVPAAEEPAPPADPGE